MPSPVTSPRRAAFDLRLPFEPTGDQPKAIRELLEGLERGDRHQTLMGVTGSGKTVTMAASGSASATCRAAWRAAPDDTPTSRPA